MTNPLLSTIAQLALGFGVPLLLFWIGSHMKDANTRAAFNAAAARAGGLAYDAMTRQVRVPPTDVPVGGVRIAALNQAVDYLRATMPETLGNLGLFEDEGKLRSLITGELGKLLATDPTVSATAPKS